MSFPMIFCTWKEANDFNFHQAIMDDTAWMALGLALGDDVTIEANGPDEEEAVQAMAAYLMGTNGTL